MLVYDGDCGFCQKCVDFGYKNLPVMPRVSRWQELDLAAHGLTLEQVTEAVQLLGPHGLRASGARAIALVLAVQPRSWWRTVGRIGLLPPVSWVAEAAYRVVARNRHRLPGGTGACAIRPQSPPTPGNPL